MAGGRLLVEGVNGSAARDTLWELDPRTGRILGALTVPGFSVNALLTVGREAWLMTADGHAIVVAPLKARRGLRRAVGRPRRRRACRG